MILFSFSIYFYLENNLPYPVIYKWVQKLIFNDKNHLYGDL
jgi:hypothetical protein